MGNALDFSTFYVEKSVVRFTVVLMQTSRIVIDIGGW